MRIIISPAKQMVEVDDVIPAAGTPVFLDRAAELAAFMRGLSYDEARALWGCSDKIAEENFQRFAQMDLSRNLTPAILAYDGIAFKYMAPQVFEAGQFDYVQDYLRILSGFYGVLRPMDGVVPYRLEMQAKAQVGDCRDLYAYWGDEIYSEVQRGNGDRIIVNLASKEYSKCVERYLGPEDKLVTCVFGELSGGRVVQKGVYAKMARGEMVRFMAEVDARVPEDIKAFDRLGYALDPARSDDGTYVFLK